MQQLQLEGTVPNPIRAITEEDWITHKSTITSLYIDQDLTLDHVKRIMKLRHGFKATEKMYKIRFKRWYLKKYTSACEKEAVAQLLDVYRRKGVDPPQISLDGRCVPLHVVRRHCRRNQMFKETCDNLPYISSSMTAKTRASEDHTDFEPVSSLDDHPITLSPQARNSLSSAFALTPEFDQTQYVLNLTNRYFQWHFRDRSKITILGDVRDYADCSDLAEMKEPVFYYRELHRGSMSTQINLLFNCIGQGLDLLVAGQPQAAWKALDKGCKMVRAVLQDQHRTLIKAFYRVFSDARWKDCKLADLRSSLFYYLGGMSKEILGPQHPLSIILRLCQNPNVFRESSHRVFQVMLDVSVFHVGSYGPEIPGLKRAHCETLMMNGEFDAAEREIKELLLELESRIGKYHYDTRRTLRRLAQIYTQQHLYQRAIPVYLDEVDRASVDLGDAFPDESCRVSYHKIAYVFNRSGDIDNAEQYWRLAHEGPVSAWHCPSYARHFGHHLKDKLILQSNLQKRTLPLYCVFRPIAETDYPDMDGQCSSNTAPHRLKTCKNCEL